MERRTKKKLDVAVVHQWNCHDIKGKMGELQQYVDSLDYKPDLTALQETNKRHRLPRFLTYTDPTEGITAVLVGNSIGATQKVSTEKGVSTA